MTRTVVEIATADGRCPASLFRPAGDGSWPAVILYMDALGPRPALFEIGERLAGNGYVVLLPDLFYRAGPYEPATHAMFKDPAQRGAWFARYVATASIPNVMADTGAFLVWLDGRPEVGQPEVGVVGYCMGGSRALAAAGTYPERVVAAASYHGGRLATDAPDSPHLLAPRMRARVYVAGAVEDASFPAAMKQRLVEAFARAGVDARVETYDGARHGWTMRDSPVFDPQAAERHWRTLLALLDGTLKRARS